MTYQKANNTETTSVFKVDGRMSSQTVKVNGKTSGITTYTDYDGAGNLTKYNYQVYNSNGDYQYTLTYTNTYGQAGKFDSYKQTGQTAHSSQSGSTDGQTTFTYDFRGYLTGVTATGSNGFSRSFTNNMLGQVVAKREVPSGGTSWQQSYVYVNGNQVAQLGKDNQFDMGVTGATGNSGTTLSITNDIASTSGQYVVNSSDSLFSIAQAVWGDSSQWYLIADANGINVAPDAALTNYVGQTLRLPNVARSEHNNATTFKPYNPQEIIGDTTPSPTPPPPPKKSCNALAMIAIIVVAVVLTVVTAGAFAAASGAMITTATGTVAASSVGVMTAGAAALSGGIAAGAAAGTLAATLGTVGTAMAAGAVGGFVGSVGSQLVGVATGQQEDFSLRSAFASGLTSAFTAGIGAYANGASATTKAVLQNGYARGASAYLSNQAANRIAGVDVSFSWKDMAVSTLASGLTQKTGNSAFDAVTGASAGEGFMGSLYKNFTSSAIRATASRLMGVGGKQEWGQIAVDAFGNALASTIVSSAINKDTEISYIQNKLKGSVAEGVDVTDKQLRTLAKRMYNDQRDPGSASERRDLIGDIVGTLSGKEKSVALAELQEQVDINAVLDASDVYSKRERRGYVYVEEVIPESNGQAVIRNTSSTTVQLDEVVVEGKRIELDWMGNALLKAEPALSAVGNGMEKLGQLVEGSWALKYGALALDIASGPVAFALRTVIAESPIGKLIDKGTELLFNATSAFIEGKTGLEAKTAAAMTLGMVGVATLVSFGASKLIKGLKGLITAKRNRGDGSDININNKLISRDSFDIDPKKFDYFHGNVKAPDPALKLSDPKTFKQLEHNYQRSQQMKRILEAEGMGNTAAGREKLLNLFEDAAKGPVTDKHVGDHGTTITRTVETPTVKYDVKFFYEGGDLSLQPKVTTMIPKVKR